ncbi:MAG: type II secretion system secretin GspD [Alphaproteobacteria bacterium]|nr:type II secretion system secretin GspD [Alphaproteobacteria bacterium]
MSTLRHSPRPLAVAVALVVLTNCQLPAEPSLEPLEQPSNLQAAEPRINSAIPTDRSRQRPFVAPGTAAAPAPPPPGPGATTTQTGDVTLNFVDTDIREIVRTILGTTLNLNYTIDPNVHGTGSIETGTPMQRSALLPTLETLLNANGATLIERNGVYAVVPLPAGATRNLVSGTNAIGAGTQVVPLRYASAKDLAKVLEPYVAEGGKIAADPAPNALIVSGDAAVRQTLVGLIRAFDIDILAGQSYALFPVGDSDPAKRASEFERVLQAQAEGALGGIVRVVPMDRVNAVLVVSSQSRYIDAARRFFRLTNELEDATARAWHVYYVQNGQSADLENLLQRAFTPRNVAPTPGPPGSTAPGAEQLTIGGGRPPGGGTTGFGGQGSTAGLGGAAGGAGVSAGLPGAGGPGAAGGLGGGIPQPPVAAEGAPPATEPLSAETGPGGAAPENRMRIIANRRNNALLIYATPSEYAVIEGMLRKIDIIPLQVLIEATIAEVDLNDALQYGTQFYFKADHVAFTLGPSGTTTPPIPNLGGLSYPSTSPYFILSKAPNVALAQLASVSKVRVLSAPQVMVLDNEPARLQVGQQVPVLTGTATSTLAANAPVVNSVDYHSTGVIMQVTPRVNSGGLVSLDIAQEVSDVAAAATNTVQGSPTFNDQIFRTRVAVQNGQTVGMAGLIRDNLGNNNTGIPFLKDIPILGALVSTQSNQRMRTELLVLITPHVVHDQRDARALTEDLRNQLINAGLVPQQLQRKGAPGLANPNGP